VFGFDPADELEPIEIENLAEASTRRRRIEADRALPGRPS